MCLVKKKLAQQKKNSNNKTDQKKIDRKKIVGKKNSNKKPTRKKIGQKMIGKVKSFDNINIHYEVIGNKKPAMIMCNGVGCTTNFWKYIVQYFWQKNEMILWDYRSHGLSDAAPDLKDLTMTNNALDLERILNENKIDKAILLGHSMGVQTILEFYRLFPERVLGLIPILGSYGHPLSTFLNTDKLAYAVPLVHFLAFSFPKISNIVAKNLANQTIGYYFAKFSGMVNYQHCKKKDLDPYIEHLSKLDFRALAGMVKKMQEHSAKSILSEINVPTLIVSGQDDLFTPWKLSKEMYDKIPNAQILTVPHGTHLAHVEQPELVNLRIEKFINEKIL